MQNRFSIRVLLVKVTYSQNNNEMIFEFRIILLFIFFISRVHFDRTDFRIDFWTLKMQNPMAENAKCENWAAKTPQIWLCIYIQREVGEREREREREGGGTHDEFDDVDGGEGGAESRDTDVEAASEELFGGFLAIHWEVWVHPSAAVHCYCPPAHSLSLSLSSLYALDLLWF